MHLDLEALNVILKLAA